MDSVTSSPTSKSPRSVVSGTSPSRRPICSSNMTLEFSMTRTWSTLNVSTSRPSPGGCRWRTGVMPARGTGPRGRCVRRTRLRILQPWVRILRSWDRGSRRGDRGHVLDAADLEAGTCQRPDRRLRTAARGLLLVPTGPAHANVHALDVLGLGLFGPRPRPSASPRTATPRHGSA